MKKFSELKVGDNIFYTIYGNAHERKILSISHNRNINSKIFYTKDGSFGGQKMLIVRTVVLIVIISILSWII